MVKVDNGWAFAVLLRIEIERSYENFLAIQKILVHSPPFPNRLLTSSITPGPSIFRSTNQGLAVYEDTVIFAIDLAAEFKSLVRKSGQIV